jgi:ribonucleoside-diphosphate reductase alpha chain
MVERYTEDQLKHAGLQYFKGDTLATNVWIKKYALKLKNENYYLELTPDETIQRISKEIHRIELKYPNPLSYEEIYESLKNFKSFIFGGSIQFGLGNADQISSLGNCFFIDNGSDSYGGIFNTDESLVQLMKRRGGVGITMEHLRPATASVNNAAQSSTGATSFMDRFSHSTREVAQDGRRGALMITMHINHPDIMDFIMKKDDLTKVTGANVSIKITDEFMNAVEKDEDYLLRWPVESSQPKMFEKFTYNKLHRMEDGSYVRRVKAKDVWVAIVKQAHKNAEPGILFWDNVIKESPADMYADQGFKTLGTNPCGEVPLSPYDSCRLGSINLYTLVEDPFTKDAKLDWSELAKRSRLAQRYMDDIVDAEEEKIILILEKIERDNEPEELKRVERETWEKVLKVLRNGRRTGVGVLGLGDMLAALNIKFGTPEATELTEKIHKVIAINSYRESVNLAKERGCFPIWNADKEAMNPFIRRVISENFDNKEYKLYLDNGRRNIANLSIAPTGSLAILSQTTSGIEPVFQVFYGRRRKVNPGEEGIKVTFVDDNGDSWEEYNVIHYPFVTWYIQQRKEVFKDLIEKGEEVPEDLTFEGVLKEFKTLPAEVLNQLVSESPWGGAESHDINYLEKVKMQGAIQKWIDHSISVTHNLPEKISIKEVNDIYFAGWKAGCKGLTIYREGSRTGVLLSKKEKEESEFKENHAPKRPRVLEADYYVATAKGVKFAVIVGLWPGTNRPYEVFAFENPPMFKNTRGKTYKVKKGQYKFVNGEFEIENINLASSMIEERTLTLAASMLLRHGAPIKYVNHVITKIDENISSFSSVVRRCLSKYIVEEIDGEACLNCGDKLIMQDGCVKCINPECGYSRCG